MPLLLLLCAAQFMVILDITVVNVALPSIQRELGIAFGDLQWAITAYTLAFGGLLLLGGRAADLFGRRRAFVAGVAAFAVASGAAALAESASALIAARVAQGVSAALLSPAALALVTTSFPEGPERRRALAAWAGVAASGGAFGVLVGGALTEALGWQAIFLINVPVAAVVVALAPRWIPAGGRDPGRRLDLAGATLAVASVVALIYGLVEAPEAGWASAQTLGLLAFAAAGLAAFAAVERRVPQPLVDLAVLRRRPTVVALALMIAGMGTVVSVFFFASIYLQHVLGHSALRTGLEFLPGALVLIATAHAGGHLAGQLGTRAVLAAGMGAGAVGGLLLSGASPDGSYVTDVLPGLLVLDAGIGMAASAIFITAMAGVAEREAGMVSGLITTAHEVGIALVLPALSTVATAGLGGAALAAAAQVDPTAITAGMGDALRVAAGIAVGAALLAALALRRDDVPRDVQPAFGH
ncbi:MAG TPA: MFS transporter [Solirubrobacterales bacterium]